MQTSSPLQTLLLTSNALFQLAQAVREMIMTMPQGLLKEGVTSNMELAYSMFGKEEPNAVSEQMEMQLARNQPENEPFQTRPGDHVPPGWCFWDGEAIRGPFPTRQDALDNITAERAKNGTG